MKRIKIMGLCLVAVFAFGAVAAGSASAARPENKLCVRVAKKLVEYKQEKIVKGVPTFTEKTKEVFDGKYTNKECTSEAPEPGTWDRAEPPAKENLSYEGPEGKYEREEAPEATPFESKSGEAVFTFTVGGEKYEMKCKKDTDKGVTVEEFGSEDTFTFSKCELPAEEVESETKAGHYKLVKISCGNTAPAGTIEADLAGGNYFISNLTEGEGGSEGEAGSGIAFGGEIPFACEGASPAGWKPTKKVTVDLEGYLIGQVVDNAHGQSITFAVVGGKQSNSVAWYGESEIARLTLTSEGEEATLKTTDEQKGVGVYLGVFPS